MLPRELMTDFLAIALYLLVGVIFAVVPLIISRLIVRRSTGAQRDETYESGMHTIGSAWMQFTAAYYIYALIFLAFDVDVLYLFPVALAYGKFAVRDFVEVVIFVGILSLAIVYAWRKGVFEWKVKE
ncbi:NADH-quinone oxidoreductase subunit A [Desulfoferrobacter suflitae]|uniref:NADH-quinone oxidoreductase subunit A n=1 Tax=Desulfoferrobacter suflitae TaxID=2865782 RepID=UPI002164B8BE|nr:NADH-quinone oxidoreductase subunit A [Desulfoferrobacter suflitae]MCK8602019.1 NADH-quinone oxidoreductase subunit A [Desulfoferrobacter suflitae]